MATIYYKILNGKKLLVDDDPNDSQVNIKTAGEIKYLETALWELTADDKGYLRFKNKSTGKYIIRNSGTGKIDTGAGGGNISKFTVTGQGNLAVDKCKIQPYNNPDVFTNVGGRVELKASKTSAEVTEQADQLFKIAYWND